MKKYRILLILLALISVIGFFNREKLTKIYEENFSFSLDEIIPRDEARERNEYFSKNPDCIKIACIGNWEKYTANGIPFKEGIEMAVKEINEAGGIKGLPVQAIWFDDHGKVSNVQQYVEQCIRDEKIWGIVGPIASDHVAVVKDRIAASGLIQMAPVCQKRNVCNKMLFKPIHSVDDEANAIYQWIAKNMADKSFVLLNEDTVFSNTMAKELEQTSYNHNDIFHNRIIFSSYGKNKSLRNNLETHHRYYPNDCYVFIGGVGSLSYAIRQAPEFLHPSTGNTLIINQESCNFHELETQNAKNIFITSSLKKDEKLKSLLSRLDDVPKFKKSLLAVYSYRGIYLFKEGLEHAPDMRPATVAQYMLNHPLETPLGTFRFDRDSFEDNPAIEILSFSQLQDFWKNYIK